MKLVPQDLEKIADLTLKHYNQRAEDFRQGTATTPEDTHSAARLAGPATRAVPNVVTPGARCYR